MNPTEEEVVFLKAINEIIDSIVNLEMLEIQGRDPECSVLFKSTTHIRFFNIILVDFLSLTDKRALVSQSSYLSALRAISDSPNFNVDGSVGLLCDATREFVQWLEQEIAVDTYLPSISKEASIRITRIAFIKMCGNIAKHNVLRSIGVAEGLKSILAASGISVDLDKAMLALDDFYDWFHADILAYHSSTIVEFLNNIRWGIHEYLLPEFRRSYSAVEGKFPRYTYIYPASINQDFAKVCYWDLMSEVRGTPYVKRFQVTEWLKKRY